MALAGGHQTSQVFVKVMNVFICLATDVGINLWSWCIRDVAAVWEDSSVDGGNKVISMPNDLFFQGVTGRII